MLRECINCNIEQSFEGVEKAINHVRDAISKGGEVQVSCNKQWNLTVWVIGRFRRNCCNRTRCPID